MFSGKNKNKSEIPGFQLALNIIGAGTLINGDIHSNGDIRIDGSIQGNVNSKSKIVTTQTSEINGNINALNADISGSVKGNVHVGEVLFLKSTARVLGDIVTGKLVVEAGAEFNGTCSMKTEGHAVDNNKPAGMQNARTGE